MASVVFVRRQSPDWSALARDFRLGAPIDPMRYVPNHAIPGFPDQVDGLIGKWNARFKIDFFTFRSVLAGLSRQSIAAVWNSRFFNYDQLSAVAALAAREDCFVYFHDDDDFFAPDLGSVVVAAETQTDAIVTPQFKVTQTVFTLCRQECTPDYIWRRLKPQPFRYQTNNYGIHGRHCTSPEALGLLKDHVLASRFADETNFIDWLSPVVSSATVKTPGSASMLPVIFRDEDRCRQVFETFLENALAADLPDAYGWLLRPLRQTAQLAESVFRGGGYESISELLEDQRKEPVAL